MEIIPVIGPRVLAQPEPVEGVGSRTSGTRPGVEAAVPKSPAHSVSMVDGEEDELSDLAARVGLELRLQKLPDSNVTVIRMVETETGEVVREFPPEGLATVLAELRSRAAARLDRKA
jgi:hypothetical protein